jgi:hypothetical protein
MNSKVMVDREWFDRVHALLYVVSGESGIVGFEAECLGSFIPDILKDNAIHPRAMVVPDGWQLVPAEPTREMLVAGGKIAIGIVPIYAAMLAAAPAPGDSQ